MITTEQTFESAIVQALIERGGYTQGNPTGYSPESGLFKDEVIRFLQESQPQKWEKLTVIHGTGKKIVSFSVCRKSWTYGEVWMYYAMDLWIMAYGFRWLSFSRHLI
jgi:hypothetical protein